MASIIHVIRPSIHVFLLSGWLSIHSSSLCRPPSIIQPQLIRSFNSQLDFQWSCLIHRSTVHKSLALLVSFTEPGEMVCDLRLYDDGWSLSLGQCSVWASHQWIVLVFCGSLSLSNLKKCFLFYRVNMNKPSPCIALLGMVTSRTARHHVKLTESGITCPCTSVWNAKIVNWAFSSVNLRNKYYLVWSNALRVGIILLCHWDCISHMVRSLTY